MRAQLENGHEGEVVRWSRTRPDHATIRLNHGAHEAGRVVYGDRRTFLALAQREEDAGHYALAAGHYEDAERLR
jgi:hypothetical protein